MVLALLIYSITSILDRVVLSRFFVSPTTYLVMAHIFVAATFLAILMLKYQGLADVRRAFKSEGPLIILIAVIIVLYRFFQVQAVALMSVGLVIAVKRTSALFATIIGGELWHEHNLGRKILACLIMVMGAALVVS